MTAIIPQWNHMNDNDDLDDDSPNSRANDMFRNGVQSFNILVQRMQQVWCGLLGVAVCMWIALLIAYVVSP